MSEFERASRRSRLGPIKELSQKIDRLAQDFKVSEFTNYSAKLNLAVDSFDVDQMSQALSEFPRMVEFLRESNEDEAQS